jgi:hypothetical protein
MQDKAVSGNQIRSTQVESSYIRVEIAVPTTNGSFLH